MRPNEIEPGDKELEYLADKDPQSQPTPPADLLLTDEILFELFMSRKPSVADLDIWVRYGDNPPKLRRIIEAQLAHSQPLIEQKAREDERGRIEAAIHSVWRTADTTQQFTNLILRKDFWDSFKSGEPLEGGKG